MNAQKMTSGLLIGLLTLAGQAVPASAEETVKLFCPPASLTIKVQIFLDIIEAVKADLPYTLVLEEYPWKRAYQMALDGEGGVITIGKTTERLPLFDFSDEVLDDEVVLVVLKGHEFPFERMEDLKGKIITVNSGSTYGDEFDRAKREIFTVDEDFEGPSVRLKKLLAGRVDAAIINPGRAGLQHAIQQDVKLRQHQDEFVVLPKPIAITKNYIAFGKSAKMQPFLEAFNRALAKAREDGTYQKILEKYTASQ